MCSLRPVCICLRERLRPVTELVPAVGYATELVPAVGSVTEMVAAVGFEPTPPERLECIDGSGGSIL